MTQPLNLDYMACEFSVGSKTINDPIHGHICVPADVIAFIDTPQFQRLRDLKQLGTTYFVFPGASHNRFEHSIGVSHLAGKLMEKFKLTQRELEISEKDILLLRLAGLCHDLGHGPFSHAFESWVHKVGKHKGDEQWKHEVMSEKMLDYLIDSNGLAQYSTDDVKFMKDIIGGRRKKERGWIYDIVSNSRNSIDVDKFDYLARDAYHIGKKTPFEFPRVMNLMRVIGDEICFHKKERYHLYQLFESRYSMFKQVYSHRVGKAIELMIADAFMSADPIMHISDQLENPEDFMSLTDSLLVRIQFSKEKELEEARQIVYNIRKRNLYHMADEAVLPNDIWNKLPQRITEADIITSAGNLKETDIIVDQYILNYAMKDKNPVDHVKFYDPSPQHINEPYTIQKESVSLMIPNKFQEKYLRVYCKKQEHLKETRQAFWKYLEQFGMKPTTASAAYFHDD